MAYVSPAQQYNLSGVDTPMELRREMGRALDVVVGFSSDLLHVDS